MAQLSEPETIEWKAGVAQCLMDIDNLPEALSILEEVYRAKPEEDSYALLLVNALLESSKRDKAIALLELLNRQERLSTSNICLLAQLYTSSGELRLAKKHFSSVLDKLNEESLPDFLKSVESVMYIGEWKYAETLLNAVGPKSLQTDSLIHKYDRLTAYCLFELNKPEARPHITKMLERTPLDGDALLLMAKVYVKAGEFEKAEVLFERAQKIEEFSYRAFLEHGKLLVGEKRYEKALEKYEAADSIKSNKQQRDYIEELEGITRRQ
ncbi:tetratricopeptide repeat protein [Rubritalea tangerina]